MSAASTGSSCAPGQVARVVVSAPWTPADLDRACAMYAAGYGVLRIGRVMGCSHSTAYARLVRAGVPLRSRAQANAMPRQYRRRWDVAWSAEAHDLWRGGATLRAVGRRYGVSAATVRRWVDRHILERKARRARA